MTKKIERAQNTAVAKQQMAHGAMQIQSCCASASCITDGQARCHQCRHCRGSQLNLDFQPGEPLLKGSIELALAEVTIGSILSQRTSEKECREALAAYLQMIKHLFEYRLGLLNKTTIQ
jgi:hypothetical protein